MFKRSILALTIFLFASTLWSMDPSRVRFVVFPFYGKPVKYSRYLWRSFCSWFSVKPYKDTEVYEVERLYKPGMTPEDAGKVFGADYVVEGRLTVLKIFYGVFYSEVVASGRIDISEVFSGRKVFSSSKTVRLKKGGVPYPLVSVPLSVFRASSNLREKALFEALGKLGEALSRSVPSSIGKDLYLVQVGAFFLDVNVKEKKKELSSKGFRVYVEESGNMKKVLVGPFYSRLKAERVADELGGIVVY